MRERDWDGMVQGNVDPVDLLVGNEKSVRESVRDCVSKAGQVDIF